MALLNGRAIRDWCRDKFFAKENMLNTEMAVKENTEEGKGVDALVIKEVFQSVSDGKGLIASAITDKGVATDASDTFAQMAENIVGIEQSGGGSFPINSPYRFIFNAFEIPFSTDSGGVTIPIVFNKLKRFVIKKLYFNMSKNSTSNSSGSVTFEILGTNKEGEKNVTIKRWWDSLSSSTNFKVVADIKTDTEIDLTNYDEVTAIKVSKGFSSGTVISFDVKINFEADLYF